MDPLTITLISIFLPVAIDVGLHYLPEKITPHKSMIGKGLKLAVDAWKRSRGAK